MHKSKCSHETKCTCLCSLLVMQLNKTEENCVEQKYKGNLHGRCRPANCCRRKKKNRNRNRKAKMKMRLGFSLITLEICRIECRNVRHASSTVGREDASTLFGIILGAAHALHPFPRIWAPPSVSGRTSFRPY